MRIVPATCPVCAQQYDPLRARATLVVDGKVRAYCSTTCKEKAALPPPELPIASVGDEEEDELPRLPAAGWRGSWRGLLGMAAAVGAVLLFGGKLIGTAPAVAVSIPSPPAKPVRPPTPAQAMALLAPQPTTGPERDLWVHPIPGPKRLLPLRDSRRFGAPREGMRPEECEGGHCGVDIGTGRGMLVLCVHDGVVQRVQRDPAIGGHAGNEGRYIRVLHKGGTVISAYIHLDAIREDLRPGLPVKAGEALGIVGDSGVRHSGPHLHFAISVRSAPDGPELFIDPEPLLHIWPLAPRPTATLHAMSSAIPGHPATARNEVPSSL